MNLQPWKRRTARVLALSALLMTPSCEAPDGPEDPAAACVGCSEPPPAATPEPDPAKDPESPRVEPTEPVPQVETPIEPEEPPPAEPTEEPVVEPAPEPEPDSHVCAPTCGDLECGSSACEASCGTCDQGKCLGGICHTACSLPSGGRGANPGQVMPDLSLYDCDGNAVSTDDFCGIPVVVTFSYHGSCPMSLSHAKLAQKLQMKYAEKGVRFVLVLTNPVEGTIPTTQTCKELRATYGATYSVLFDPKGQFGTKLVLGADHIFVSTSGPDGNNRIVARGHQMSFQTWLTPILDGLIDD